MGTGHGNRRCPVGGPATGLTAVTDDSVSYANSSDALASKPATGLTALTDGARA